MFSSIIAGASLALFAGTLTGLSPSVSVVVGGLAGAIIHFIWVTK